MRKIRFTIILFIILLLSNVLVANYSKIYAIEDNEYSELYKKYLELSDEEKEKIEVIPRKYDVSLDMIYDDTIEVKEDSNIFNLFGLFAKSTIVSQNAESIPLKFDLRDEIDIKIENQDLYGICWNFASMTSLETYLALNGYGDYDFSELHLDYIESDEIYGDRGLHQGGTFENFVDYIINNYGPVLEEEVPYNAHYTEDDYDYLLSLESKAYLDEVVNFPTINKLSNTYTEEELTLFRNKIKKHIMENGSVYTYIDAEQIYDFDKKIQCLYDTDNNIKLAHAVSIIGWDDNFSKDNFTDNDGNKPNNDGAYIALNSWGSSWGDNGIFYISYEDALVEYDMNGIEIASTKNETKEENKIKFEDENLYNAIKEELQNYILKYDDEEFSIEISKIVRDYIIELDLSNKNIEDLSGIESFENLQVLNLSNNNISNIESLLVLENLCELDLSDNKVNDLNQITTGFSNLYNLNLSYNNVNDVEKLKYLGELRELDLSGNKNLVNIEELTNISYLTLNNCGLDDTYIDKIASLQLYSISLEYNNITDPLKLQSINSVNLSGNKSLDLDLIPNVEELILNDCNISDLSFLESYTKILWLQLRNNPIEDISYLEDMDNLLDLDLSYTNVKDVSGLTNVKQKLALSGNTEIIGVESLSQLTYLEMEDCDINDASFISNLKDLYGLYLKNNNISNIDWLEDLEYIDEIDLSYNAISDFGILDVENMYEYAIDNQKIDIELEVVSNTNIKIDSLPIIEEAYKNRYKEKTTIITENCEIDHKNEEITLNAIESGENTATVKIVGGKYDGSVYTIKYIVKETLNIIDIEVKKNSNKTQYIAGENFDSTGMIIEATYDNNVKIEITDYVIINGEDLKEGQTEIVISYKGCTAKQTISVYGEDSIKKLKFNDAVVYEKVINKIGKSNIISQDDLEKEIIVSVDVIDNIKNIYLYFDEGKDIDLTGISGLNKLEYIFIDKGKNIDFTDLANIETLTGISINDNDTITDISNLNNIIKNLKYVYGGLNKITNIGDMMNSQNFEELFFDNYMNLEELENDGNIVVLPQYFKASYEQDSKITAKVYYENIVGNNEEMFYDDEGENIEIKVDQNGNLYIELDKEINENKKEQKRAIKVFIEDGKAAETSCVIYYDVTKELNGIEVETLPKKTEYVEGELFDSTGMVVNKIYSNGDKETINNYEIDLVEGLKTTDNVVTISYTEGNITKTAQIDITVNKKEEEKEEKLYVTSEKYEILESKKYINKINPKTTIKELIENLNSNGNITVINKNGDEVSKNSLIGTGMNIIISNDNEEKKFEAAVLGDLDGNGKVTATDLSTINQVILKIVKLTDLELKAADLDENEKITATDLSTINNYILGNIKLLYKGN